MKTMYELMLVVKPEADVTDKTAPVLVQKMVGDLATVSDVTVIGKKALSYPIRKFTEGIYVQAKIESNGLHVSDLEKKIQLGSEVLRYLLTAGK